jgi:type II secretory pathway component PulJ
MIDDEVACKALALLGTAAVMLIEDAHPLLATSPRTTKAAAELAAAIAALGADLTASGAAAAVLYAPRP